MSKSTFTCFSEGNANMRELWAARALTWPMTNIGMPVPQGSP